MPTIPRIENEELKINKNNNLTGLFKIAAFGPFAKFDINDMTQ